MFPIVNLFVRNSFRQTARYQSRYGAARPNVRRGSSKSLSTILLRLNYPTSSFRFFGVSTNPFESFIKRYRWRFSGIVFGFFCAGVSYYYVRSKPLMQVTASEKEEPKILPPSVRKTMNFIVEIVEKVAPSVVLIETIGTQHTVFGTALFQGSGSGFVVRSDGLILTNAHVVQRSRRVRVQMYDGKIYEGEVAYFDATSDLATVKIKATNLPVIKLANSREAKAGEIVIALGSPLSLSNSVTFGIISNSQRRLENMPFSYIQTDAAITTGNSGGPLVNLDGEAVGISSMTVQNAPGISFAIPSDYARAFLEKTFKADAKQKTGGLLSSPGSRKQIGVTMFSLDAQVLKELKFRNKNFSKVDHGILIHTIQVGSPAHQCGMEPGDVVIEVDGKSIFKSEDLMNIIQNSTSSLNFTIVRQNKTIHLTITPEIERD